MTSLNEWQNFYVITGSAAGALIGLQFVVITLIANVPRVADQQQAGAAFATPTVVHFAAVLLLAAVTCAPWWQVLPIAVVWGTAGLLGVAYTIWIAYTMRRQTAYKPELEDWMFHATLPCAAYALLATSAWGVFFQQRLSFFGVATATLSLLFIGIHNAWDAVTYHLFVRKVVTGDR